MTFTPILGEIRLQTKDGGFDRPELPPDREDSFSYRLFISIGMKEIPDSSDEYTCLLVSTSYLIEHPKPMTGAFMIVVDTFDWDEIMTFISDMIGSQSFGSWEEANRQLRHIFCSYYEPMTFQADLYSDLT